MRAAAMLIGLVMLGATALAAPPASKPASPTTRPDQQAVEFPEHGFRLYVPKAWKSGQRTGGVATFEVPGGAFVILTGKVKGEGELAKQVELKKTRLEGSIKGFKLARDEATTLGSQPAWVLLYDATLTGKLVDQKTGKQGTGTITSVNRVMEVTAVKDNTLVQISFVCAEQHFAGRVKLAEKALSSFEWTAGEQKQ